MEEFLSQLGGPTQLTPLAMLIALWSLPWKGVALWKAAGKRSKGWFIALLLINTAGLLDALYIFFFSKKGELEEEKKEEK